jgi:predicted nucleic acid-binding protein
LIAGAVHREGARLVHRDRDFETIAAVTPLRTRDLHRPS